MPDEPKPRRRRMMESLLIVFHAFGFTRDQRLDITNKVLFHRGEDVPEATSFNDLSDEELATMLTAMECAAYVAHLCLERQNTRRNRKQPRYTPSQEGTTP